MRVFRGFSALPAFRHAVVAIGSFDGVHLGHRALIERLVTEARRIGGESIVLTFEPHPRIALGHSEGLRILTSLDEKTALLENIGVDCVIVIPFDHAFSTLSGHEFIRQHICRTVGAEAIIVGYNHRFGHDRLDADGIEALGVLRVVRVGECRIDGRHVSSSVIRRLLDEGRVAEAEELLGHGIMNS